MKNSVYQSDSKPCLQQIERVIENNISNPLLTNYQLATALGVSCSLLTENLKDATGVTPRKYIREYRLKMAFKYLESGKFLTVGQTASAVGFINVGYFNRKFTARFNISPFQVLKNNGWR